MRNFFIGVFCLIGSSNSALATSLDSFAGRYAHAQFIQDNLTGLGLRVALLDAAAPKSTIRIATYVFDFGSAVQLLSSHMCKAVKRGAHVQLIVDSKSGELVGSDDPFDGSSDAKKTEELYQYLSNCGVDVRIHNFSTSFVKLAPIGARLPNIFPGVADGGSVQLWTARNRVNAIKNRLEELLRPTLQSLGVQNNLNSIIDNIQSIGENLYTLQPGNGNSEVIASRTKAILNDPAWQELTSEPDPKKLLGISAELKNILDTDPELKAVRDALRIFNRLNHRKLFVVEQPSGESCFVIGGRNLGDSYLTNSATSYRDGDVFACRRHNAGVDNFLVEANADLDQLINDTTDPILGADGHTTTMQVPRNAKFKFHIDLTKMEASASSLPKTIVGVDLPNFDQPEMLTSSWDPQTDQVRYEMLRAIQREQKEIYIETAYAEFNNALRRDLEEALERGVKVTIVTNGLFITDGASKLIRFWMAYWNEQMATKYPDQFRMAYATLAAGHMIHFKGAGFRCQKNEEDGGVYREYIVGSHNFHPRSGYSDKENSIRWREKTGADCAIPNNDMIADRFAYYQVQQKQSMTVLLRGYTNLSEELSEVSVNGDPANANLAQTILQALFVPDSQGNLKINNPEQLEKFRDAFDETHLRDFVGILF